MNGRPVVNSVGVDGIALSPDFSTVFYAPLAGVHLFSIQASVLRFRFPFPIPLGDEGSDRDKTAGKADFNRVYKTVGVKYGSTDGMVMSSDKLYYGILDTSTVQPHLPPTSLPGE